MEASKNRATSTHIELKELLEKEEKRNEVLTWKLEDKEMICNKMELAYKAHENLLEAKSEIISNLKIIISREKETTCLQVQDDSAIVTSNERSIQNSNDNGGDKNPPSVIPGLQETTLCFK